MVTLGSCQLLRFFLLIIGKMARGMPQREGRVEIQTSTSCLDFDFAGFHCVPIFQCSNEGVIKTDAGGLFDPRYFYHHHLSSGNAMKRHNSITISSYSDYITNANSKNNFAGRQEIIAETLNTLMVSVALRREAKLLPLPVQLHWRSAASIQTAPNNTQVAIWKVSPADPTVVLEQMLTHLRSQMIMTMRSAMSTTAESLELAAVWINQGLAARKTS